MTHRHTDWLNANKYTPEERRNMCLDLMGEAQYWDSAQYVRHMHDSTKRPWVGLTDEEIKHVEETTTCLENESWLRNLTRNIEAKLKEKNT